MKKITDKEMLDWLEKNSRKGAPIWFRFHPEFMGWGHVYMNEDDNGLPSYRAAIRAAIRAEAKGEK